MSWPGAHIGERCNICDHAFVESGAWLGNNMTVKNGVAIWEGITIEDNVFLGPNCVLTNDYNPRAYIKKAGASLERTLIRNHSTIGANATVICGITIGRFAFMGAPAHPPDLTRWVADHQGVVRNRPDYCGTCT